MAEEEKNNVEEEDPLIRILSELFTYMFPSDEAPDPPSVGTDLFPPDPPSVGTDPPSVVTVTSSVGTVTSSVGTVTPSIGECSIVDSEQKKDVQHKLELLSSLVARVIDTPAINTLTLTNPDFKKKIKPMIDALTRFITFIKRDDTINNMFCYRSILYENDIDIANKLNRLASKLFADIVEQTKDIDLSEFIDPVISNVEPYKRELKIMFSIIIEDSDFVPLPNEFKRLLKIINHFVELLTGNVSKTSNTSLFSFVQDPLIILETPLLKSLYLVAKNNPEGKLLISPAIVITKALSVEPIPANIRIALCAIESMLPSLNAGSIKTFKDAYDSNMNKAKLNQILGLLQEIALHHGNDKIDPITCPTAGEMIMNATGIIGGGYREKKRGRQSTRKKHAKGTSKKRATWKKRKTWEKRETRKRSNK